MFHGSNPHVQKIIFEPHQTLLPYCAHGSKTADTHYSKLASKGSDVNAKCLIDLFPYIILIQPACLGEEALVAHEVLPTLSAITSASSLFSAPIALNEIR
jgi:hypothetical protein